MLTCIRFILLAALFTNSAVFADADSPASVQVVDQSDGTKLSIATYFCPQPKDLHKNGLFWGTTKGNWRGYTESFDTGVTAFLGGQWAGISVGKMICIYRGNLSFSFPIIIQNDTLAQAPAGGLWGKDLGGYRNCHSGNIYDCPFIVKKQAVNMQQIYKSLDFFKGKPNPLNTNQ